MTKVYVAEAGWGYEGFEILGVFSTKERAQECLDNTTYRYDSTHIEEFYLDVGSSGANYA